MKYMIIIIMLFAASCHSKSYEQKLLHHVNDPDKKITQSITIGGVTATMKYLPKSYRELLNKDGIDNDKFHYFTFRLDKPSGVKPTKEQMMYFNFELQNDLAMLVGNDSLPPAICQKIENGRAGSYEYMLAFERTHTDVHSDLTLFYNDKLLSMGKVAFHYEADDLEKIPVIKKMAK